MPYNELRIILKINLSTRKLIILRIMLRINLKTSLHIKAWELFGTKNFCHVINCLIYPSSFKRFKTYFPFFVAHFSISLSMIFSITRSKLPLTDDAHKIFQKSNSGKLHLVFAYFVPLIDLVFFFLKIIYSLFSYTIWTHLIH